MQNVNDDMDALIRKAGVDYPLFTGSADWSKVASALQNSEVPPLPKKNYGKYLGLFLLLLLPWLLTQFDNEKPKSLNDLSSNPPSAINEPGNKGSLSYQTAESINRTSTGGSETKTVAGNIAPPDNHGAASAHQVKGTGTPSQKHTGLVKEMNLNNRGTYDQNQASGQSHQNILNQDIQAERSKVKNIQVSQMLPGLPSGSLVNVIRNPAFSRKSNLSLTGNASLDETQPSPIMPVIHTGPRKKFYLGIIGGLNLTTIKMQDVKEVGKDYGLIAGYQFMKGWSIEAGVLSSSKYYYSDGEYLNNSKIYLPPNSKIRSVEGDCRMIEIPMVIKYDFGFKKAHNWFATAGVSSFLMKKEDYAYDYYYVNTGTSYLYKKTYKNESENWAAVMQLSAGYSRSIPFHLNFRVEPFIQIPLKGAGYGKLPLTSAGLRLGITRSLF